MLPIISQKELSNITDKLSNAAKEAAYSFKELIKHFRRYEYKTNIFSRHNIMALN